MSTVLGYGFAGSTPAPGGNPASRESGTIPARRKRVSAVRFPVSAFLSEREFPKGNYRKAAARNRIKQRRHTPCSGWIPSGAVS
ncbi:MAG: hypothetical protein R2941_08480, partial [Desulfobacterales bacterium]